MEGDAGRSPRPASTPPASAYRMSGQAPFEAAVSPAVAPRVMLVGAQQGSGFEERQWLVQRNGQFLQISELLYRVLEELDGRRSLEEIAARVSETTPWSVSPDNIGQILRLKLIPLGLVEGSDSRPAAGQRRRSPLAVNLRIKAIGPTVLEPLTRVLQRLYSPRVAALALICIVASHIWLYANHGVGAAITSVLMNSLLLGPVLLIFLLAAAVHELGHASALRYAGGVARAIGVGVYLVYPVFYTDTTDAYRLPRWSRVRVDVGGFYFHLIAATALILLATATGVEWLLFVVLLINFDVLRQLLLPFIRLDGYWLLADLTGIPDFFSQTGPFLRSLLPGKRGHGAKLPPLRRWVKLVFAGYVATTVPILAFLLYETVTKLPGFVEVALQSFQLHKAVVADAFAAGDVLTVMTSAVQMLLLAMPALGTTLFVVLLALWGARSLWRRVPARLFEPRARPSPGDASTGEAAVDGPA